MSVEEIYKNSATVRISRDDAVSEFSGCAIIAAVLNNDGDGAKVVINGDVEEIASMSDALFVQLTAFFANIFGEENDEESDDSDTM